MSFAQRLEAELLGRYPLINTLEFDIQNNGNFQRASSLIGLLSILTDETVEGDVCAVLPAIAELAPLASIFIALNAAHQRFPTLLKSYLETGFQTGERVRVLPSRHVYEFGGIYDTQFGDFFRLRFIDDETNASRSFPIQEAVRLEKTTGTLPKGRGEDWGDYQCSELDFMIGTRTGGNKALLQNEVMVVSTIKEFRQLINRVHVRRIDEPVVRIKLGEVIPWGIIDHRGSIEFQGGGVAGGEPLIGVASQLAYVAAAADQSQKRTPKVIVSGAAKVRDLQAFDNVVDGSKLLMLADYADLDNLAEISTRNCSVWTADPDMVQQLLGKSGIARTQRARIQNAASSQFNIMAIERSALDNVYDNLRRIEETITSNEYDESDKAILGKLFNMLIRVSGMLWPPDGDYSDLFDRQIADLQTAINSRRVWLSSGICDELSSDLQSLRAIALDPGAEFRINKRDQLDSLVNTAKETGGHCVVTNQSNFQAGKLADFLRLQADGPVTLRGQEIFSDDHSADQMILFEWPKKRAVARLLSRKLFGRVDAICSPFEVLWFQNAVKRMESQLDRWRCSESKFKRMTGLDFAPTDPRLESPRPVTVLPRDISDLEVTLGVGRKGSASTDFGDYEPRDARYVGFIGDTYAYLTESHEVPTVTSLFHGDTTGGTGVDFKKTENLFIGDLVAFRYSSDDDPDIVRTVAKTLLGVSSYQEVREIAESWKFALRSLGSSPVEITKRLEAGGLSRTETTVRLWLADPNRIGPASKTDLEIIAKTSGFEDLGRSLNVVWDSIKKIRALHIRAGSVLSTLLFEQLPEQLPSKFSVENFVNLEYENVSLGKLIIVEVEDISELIEKRNYNEINRILREET